MARRLIAAALLTVFLAGCSENSPENVSDTQSTAPLQTQTETTLSADKPVYARDIDPMAADRNAEGMPYFLSSRMERVEFAPLSDACRIEGRYIMHNDVCYLSYTCSSVSFMMTGDKIEAVMTSNGGVYPERQQGYIGVMINGGLVQRIRLEDGEETYTVYEGKKLTNARITLMKLSENQTASTGIKSISCNAEEIVQPEKKPLKIEFIGDSITCGYGNEADSPSDGMRTSQQNAAATYGYYTACDLNAEPSMVCISGIGLISDYTDSIGQREDYLLLNDIYEYADANFQLRRGYTDLTPWDFGSGSDIVVINIGTNDYSFTGRDDDLQYEFYAAYRDFLKTVRKNNPNADIICTLGIMGSELYGRIERAAERYSEDTGDDRVYTMKFDYQSEEDGYGGNYHPSVKTHRKAADKLTEFIKENIPD